MVSIWRRARLQTKLTFVTMATCISGLLLAGAGIVGYELVSAKQGLVNQLGSVADLIGVSSTAAVQFRDTVSGQEALRAFRSDPRVHAARIDLLDGTPFAEYTARASRIPLHLPQTGVVNVGDTVIVSRIIEFDGRPLGSIRVQGSLDLAYAQVRRYVFIIVGVLAVSCLLAYVLSSALQGVISGPILRLAAVAQGVSTSRNYSTRAEVEGDDELGQLVAQFNDMLAQIERRDNALGQAQGQLEARVAERTRTLELEIVERRRTENELILAKAAAEEASVAKSAFLANMSHELRTPLNAILGYSEMLKEEADEHDAGTWANDLTKIINAGRHLLALITDVLDLSKIEAGKMELHIEEFDVAELVRSVAGTSQTLADARGNRLSVAGLERLATIHS
ncbi:MAG: histidine kinase dimerization/phospho-acceptor domain-containing protein, partial [Acidobacteriota bacterium]